MDWPRRGPDGTPTQDGEPADEGDCPVAGAGDEDSPPVKREDQDDRPGSTTRINFCPSCGTGWDATWTGCPVCAERAAWRLRSQRQPPSPLAPVVSALALYFVLLLTTIVAAVVVAFAEGIESVAGEAHMWLAVDIADAIIVLVWCVFSWRNVAPGLRAFATAWWYLAACGLAAVTFAVAGVVVTGLVRLLGAEELRYTEPFLEAGYGWSTIIVTVCVQPAIVEELAFRGVVLSALGRVLGARDAVVVSALLFMVIHLTVLSFPHLFLIGLALGFLRVKTGSLYPCMLLHFVHNLLVAVSEVWLE
jgi:membrane protease YdiL (CAAX protease family)